MKKSSSDFDIVVVGGGIGGIYTAWRLIMADKADASALKKWKKKRQLRIAVYEGSDHIGGRLLSATPPNFNSAMNCELGGMRIVSSQRYASSLVIDKLKLAHPKQVVGEAINVVYLRRKLLRNFQLSDPDSLPYNLTEEETLVLKSGGATADNFLGWAVLKLIPGVNGLAGDDLKQYLQSVVVDGIPLYQHGFWDLVSKVLSHEAYRLAIKAVGYDVLGSNTNAVNCIAEYFDFTPTSEFYLIDGGFGIVPWTLQKAFEEAGGNVLTGQWLDHFDEVQLEDGTKGVELIFHDQPKPVNAAALVLAMPPRSLRLLRQTGPVMDPVRAPQLRKWMNALSLIGLFKMVLVYDHPWWEKKAYVTKGRSLTDLPVRQLYYWGVEMDPDTGSKGKAVLMAYNDMESATFWSGFRTGGLGPDEDKDKVKSKGLPKHIHLNTNTEMFRRKNGGVSNTDSKAVSTAAAKDPWLAQKRKNWDDHPAPKRMVEEMHKQIMEMHGVTEAPLPIDAAFKNWGDDPFGAAVHFWNSGYKSWEVMPAVTKPVDDFPCFICGEAWSENQTWVEGALQTSEIVLQKHFGLTEPDWVSKKTN